MQASFQQPSKPRISLRPSLPRSANAASFHPIRRRNLDFFIAHIVNSEPSTPLPEVQDSETPQSMSQPLLQSAENTFPFIFDPPPKLASKVEEFLRCAWLCVEVIGIAMLIVTFSYRWVENLSESPFRWMSFFPVIWSWTQRFGNLRENHDFPSLRGFVFRLFSTIFLLCLSPFTIRAFIFQHEPDLLFLTGTFALITVALHFLIRRKNRSPPIELQKPDLETVALVFSEDVSKVEKLERRLSMLWIFFSGVLVLPFLHEIFYRGIVVMSNAYVHSGMVAASVAALAYNLSHVFESWNQQIDLLISGFLWGLVLLVADGNIMFSFLAHMMHNAILMGVYHHRTLIECF